MTPERFQRLKGALSRRQLDLTVLLDGVHKIWNLSAVIRTADAVGLFAVHSVLVDESDKVEISRTHSSGTGKWVEWTNHPSTGEAVAALKKQGFLLVGADLDETSVDFREIDYRQPVAVVMGAEKFGLSPEAKQLVDQKLMIPMAGLGGSLNVSVATAVILFEAQRQRRGYQGSTLPEERFHRILFEWCHPEIAEFCRLRSLPYPALGEQGNLKEKIDGMTEAEIKAYMRGPWSKK